MSRPPTSAVLARSPWWMPWLFGLAIIGAVLMNNWMFAREAPGAVADDASRCLLAQLIEHRNVTNDALNHQPPESLIPPEVIDAQQLEAACDRWLRARDSERPASR